MTTFVHKVKEPGKEWQEMADFLFALELDGAFPTEISFHTGYPMDLAEAFENWAGIAVTYCSQPNTMEIRL